MSKFKSMFTAAGLGLMLSTSVNAEDGPNLGLCVSETEPVDGQEEIVEIIKLAEDWLDTKFPYETYSLTDKNGSLSHVFFNVQDISDGENAVIMVDEKAKLSCLVSRETYDKFKP